MFSGTTAGYMTPTGTPNLFNSVVTYTLTGGTGRFVGATGTIEGVGLLDRGLPRPFNDLTLSGTLNLAAVLEPATWGLTILGFGLVGGTLRRRGRDAPTEKHLRDGRQPADLRSSLILEARP